MRKSTLLGVAMAALLCVPAMANKGVRFYDGNGNLLTESALTVVTSAGVSQRMTAPADGIYYINANDGTVEGLDVVGKPCFTVQFHPEAFPGPHDAAPLFLRFRAVVDEHLGGAS